MPPKLSDYAKVSCHTCKASPGQRCRTSQNKKATYYHIQRMNRYWSMFRKRDIRAIPVARRMMRANLVKYRQVICTYCGAQTAEACRSNSSAKSAIPHKARIELWRQLHADHQ